MKDIVSTKIFLSFYCSKAKPVKNVSNRIICFHSVRLDSPGGTPLSLFRGNTTKSRTKSLNWPWLNEFGRNIERTSFALLTLRPCRTRINIFANMYVSPAIYDPRVLDPFSSHSFSLYYSVAVAPSCHRWTLQVSETNNQVDVERKLSFFRPSCPLFSSWPLSLFRTPYSP